MGKVDDLRALREARYGQPRDRRPIGLVSYEPPRIAKATTAGSPVLEEPVVNAIAKPATAETVEVSAAESTVGLAVPSVTEDLAPEATPGRPIQAYKQPELEAIVARIYSPGMTVEQMIDAVCAELGFLRRGKVIKVRVREAFEACCG